MPSGASTSLTETESRVLIVGAGAAGLSTAAALGRRGIAATVVDRDDRIGGTWSRRYARLRLHTVRRFSGLAHRPIPKDLPRYLTKDDYASYLREYADAMQVNVSLGERVEKVDHVPGPDRRRGFEVVTSGGTRIAAVVVIATGHYAEPYVPVWEGLDEFGGVFLHSSVYSTGASYAGQSVLVIGLGNSGAEIAADLAEQRAATVSVAVRRTPPIVTRELLGVVPVQYLGIALTPLRAPRLVDRGGAALRRIAVGDLSRYGLGEAAWGPFTARRPALIDTGFLKELTAGRITVRPEVTGFDGRHVVFVDGSREPFDVVVAATGFRTGLETILGMPGLLDDAGQPLWPSGRPTSVPGLYFVGFDETVRGHLFEANRESRRLGHEIERYLATVGETTAVVGSSPTS